jgi:putative inorganic carbon (HCO3(-)) transporter
MTFFGLLLLVFLIIIQPQYILPVLAHLPLVAVVSGLLILGCVVSPVSKRLLVTSTDKFFGIFCISMVLSTISAHYLTYTLETIVDVLRMAVIYYLVVVLVNDARRFRVMTWTLAILLSAVAGMAVLQYYGHDIIGIGMLWSSGKAVWQVRGTGMFDNPNDLAYSIVLVVPFAIGFVLGPGAFVTRVFSVALLWVTCFCIFVTGSRGGFVGAVVASFSWLYFWIINNKHSRRLAAIFAILLIALAVSAKAGGYREDESSMYRIEAWSAGFAMLKSHPLIGVGKGQFVEHFRMDSHSSYVRCAAELGLLGLYAWLGVIYSSVISLQRRRKGNDTSEWKVYACGYAGYVFAYLCGSVFSTRTYDLVFLLAVAMISALERLTTPVVSDGKSVELPKAVKLINKNVALLTIAVIVVLKLFMMQVW